MLQVKGYRILVKPEEVENTYGDSKIIMVLDEKLERAGQQFGEVIGIGDSCWSQEEDIPDWCEVGDRVLFSKHAGRFVYDPENEEEFMVMNDTDVIAVVK